MPGDGTRTDITTANPPARLLDLTRVTGLMGRTPTGIERVSLAYLRALSRDSVPCFGLARSKLGYLLLDQRGVEAVLDRLEGRVPWGPPDLMSYVLRDKTNSRRVTESDLRRLCIGRAPSSALGWMLRRRLPRGTLYVNVDHVNMPALVFDAVKSVPEAKVAVFLHDTIPLDYPEFQGEGAIKFEHMFARVQANADIILTNSEVSRQDIVRNMTRIGPVPPIIVSHLGVETNLFHDGKTVGEPMVPSPYFITVGTISPRKNVGFLVDLWEEMARETPMDQMPHLVIAGRRGWLSRDLFTRLDASPMRGVCLHEFNDLEDDALGAVTAGATAMLFPSVVEGFGLPPVEAAAAGVPVICNELPVMREILGDYPVYAEVTDSYAWMSAIKSLAEAASAPEGSGGRSRMQYSPPTWDAHFNTVLKHM